MPQESRQGNKMKNKIYLSFLICVLVPSVWGRDAVNPNAASSSITAAQSLPTVQPTTAAASGSGLETSTTAGTTQPTVSTTPSVRDASKGSSDMSGLTSIISVVTGGVQMGLGATYASQCNADHPAACAQAALHFMMGAQAMAQAAASKGQSGDAAATQGQVDWSSGAGYGTTDYSSYLKDAGVDSKQLSAYNKSLTSAQGLNGFKLSKDGKTLTMPDGTKMQTSTANSAASLAGAGFDKGMIAAAMKGVAKTEKAIIEKMGAHTAAMGYNEGGGAGMGKSKTADTVGGYGLNPNGMGTNNPLRDPAAASVAGLSSDFNGEKIGVAQDQIFQMISRRYDHKSQGEGFLPPLKGPR